MPVTEKQLVDAANSFVGYANKGKFDPKVWELVADPATFVFIDGFGGHSND